jgi:predicted CXXCH cytochrome family protein
MVQPATTASVKGDFSRSQITLRGAPYRLRQRDGVFYITESYLTGKPEEHRVDYTLGNRRIQHYLTTLADGRVVVLPPSWDVQRRQWFHNFDIADPDETEGVLVQVWNKNCFSCHVSQEEKRFDLSKNEYKTAWLDFGTNCERCHGPGSDHVAHYRAVEKPPAGPARDIVLQTRLDPARNTQVCGQCHYYDYFLPILEYAQPADKDPAYWPDGRTRRFSNDAFGLWQSECFLKGGVTCVACHVNAHETEIERNPQLRPDANALCTRCHESLGKALETHTHHPAASAGSSCVECHMPRTVLSIKAEIRDHSMSIPAPENTIRHAIPNACNVCHKDRDAAWALRAMDQWYTPASRQKMIRRADAFAAARAGDRRAVPLLLAILAAPTEGPLTRANAAGYLGAFTADPPVYTALENALFDSEPVVRATAALRLNAPPAARQRAADALAKALADPVATVRLGAAVTLVSMGVRKLPGEDGERFARAQDLYRARAAHNADDAEQQLGAGKFYFLLGDPVHAIESFQASLKLDPAIQAQYYLAGAYAEQGALDQARTILEAIPPADPQYEKAQRLLKTIAQSGR